MRMSKIARVVLCAIPLSLLGCGPDVDSCSLYSETRCRKARHCRVEMGRRIDHERMCLGTKEMAFCHRPPVLGCINDTGAFVRAPDGTCWSIGNSCFDFPEGWSEDETCAGSDLSTYPGTYPYCM